MGDDARIGELNEALELLHFGFRGATRRPDEILAAYGFGRVHHRVLFFVGRNPGVSVGGLLGILGVSKQALNRPLRELTERGLVEAAPGVANRRQKLLRLTEAGAELEERLSGSQRERFAEVFSRLDPRDERGWRNVMRLLAERSIPARPG
jgi:DNA-binding MarR family transcriptional regulator